MFTKQTPVGCSTRRTSRNTSTIATMYPASVDSLPISWCFDS
jgi:hypothetical protein